MPRKMRKVLPPAESIADAPKSEPLIAPEIPEPKRKVGRPSKADLAERQAQADALVQAQRDAEALKPHEMLPITTMILRLISRGIKGDAPTRQEIDFVNTPATMVANKYAFATKWAAELALLGSLMIVTQQMRERAVEKLRAESNLSANRAEVQRQEPSSPAAN